MVTQEVTRLFRKCEAQLQRFGEQHSTSEADEKVHPAGSGADVCVWVGNWHRRDSGIAWPADISVADVQCDFRARNVRALCSLLRHDLNRLVHVEDLVA